MGEVVVPRPCDHPRITKGSEGSGVRVRVRGFGFGNPIYRQGVYLRLSSGFGVRGSAPPCGWVAESPPTGDIPESHPFQIQSRRDARSCPPQEKGQPPERSPLMHERPDLGQGLGCKHPNNPCPQDALRARRRHPPSLRHLPRVPCGSCPPTQHAHAPAP